MLAPMSLWVRFNLVLATALALLCFVCGYAAWSALHSNAKQEMAREAGLMIESALATHAYTAAEIVPLLSERMQTKFLPQSVPFYAATQNFLKLHEAHPEYSYKEAALNPTNPRDRATDWEADLIEKFRNDSTTLEIVGERDTPVGRSLYLARPVRVEDDCLVCHGTPSSAPQTLIARYGGDNGFGWQNHEIVGAHVVSVPLEGAMARSAGTFRGVLLASVLVALAVLLIVNGALYYLVIRPIRRMSAVAEKLSIGDDAVGEFPRGGSIELDAFARSFGRLRTSLEKAMKLLER